MTKRAKQLREDRTRNRSFNGECSVNNVESSNNGSNPSENIKDLFNKAVEEWKAKYDSEILALKGGESSSQFRWFAIAKIEL